MYRPFGRASLGLGWLALAPAAAQVGVSPAALVAGGAFLLGEVGLRAAERILRGTKEKNRLEIIGLLCTVVPALGAGATFASGTARGWTQLEILMGSTLVFWAAILGVWLSRDRFLRREGVNWSLRASTLALDSAGLALGFLIEAAASRSGWYLLGPIVLVIALLAASSGRHLILLEMTEEKLRDLEKLQQAHVRILTETSGMAGIAQQILVECRNVLPLGWFQFELLAEGVSEEPGDDQRVGSSAGRSWSAGPDGGLFEGDPAPPRRPEMLPGIHRRADWRLIEAPLEAEGNLLAVVRIWCDPRRFEPGAEKLFSTLVPQMASSVHRACLDREAKLDPLTGVPVRRILEASLQKAYRQCFEEGQSMAVIMCDIDYFKKVNDSHGHAAGDEALKLVAQTLASQRREGDLCCRYGGEEFTLLLEKTDGPSALQLAERLRSAVEGLDLVFEGRPIPLTLSLGIAAFPEVHIKTASELLLLADEALYQCKEQGRNRCLLYLGNRRFQDVSGEALPRPADEGASAPPRIFG